MTKWDGIVTNRDSSFYYKGVYLYVEGSMSRVEGSNFLKHVLEHVT